MQGWHNGKRAKLLKWLIFRHSEISLLQGQGWPNPLTNTDTELSPSGAFGFCFMKDPKIKQNMVYTILTSLSIFQSSPDIFCTGMRYILYTQELSCREVSVFSSTKSVHLFPLRRSGMKSLHINTIFFLSLK